MILPFLLSTIRPNRGSVPEVAIFQIPYLNTMFQTYRHWSAVKLFPKFIQQGYVLKDNFHNLILCIDKKSSFLVCLSRILMKLFFQRR